MPIFIAEVKVKSPFGYESDDSWADLFDLANTYGDWISIHTDPQWGGSFEDIKRAHTLTEKPILAKGIHASDDDIIRALDYGAQYVLVVDRVPADSSLLQHCLLEVSNKIHFESTYIKMLPHQRYVVNSRSLRTGVCYSNERFQMYRNAAPTQWLCQASFIQSKQDVHCTADAFIVGTHLRKFCEVCDPH